MNGRLELTLVRAIGVTLVLTSALLALSACAARRPSAPLPEVVPFVDLERYQGNWFEIARFPFRLQEGCYATTATYTARTEGKVDVLNQCRKGSFDGEVSRAKATARVVDTTTNAKLKVTFFWPFSGDYWIVDLGKEYDYAVVSVPDRRYLWILSRTPTMDDALYREIVERLKAGGYEVSRLLATPQVRESGTSQGAR